MKFILSLVMVLLFCTATVTKGFSQIADTTITVKVKGVGCAADVLSIKANIEKLEGITVCEPGKKGPTTTFNVTYNPNAVSKTELDAAIEDTPGCQDPKDRPYKVKKEKVKKKKRKA